MIGRELAAQYPALGWGRGREDDSDEGVDYGEKLWHLIREGHKPAPGKMSPEFQQHLEEFLQSQLKSAGSSGGPGAIAADEDLSAVPFARVRMGIVQRYAKWLYGKTWTLADEDSHPRDEEGRWIRKQHAIRQSIVKSRGHRIASGKLRKMARQSFADFARSLKTRNDFRGHQMIAAANAVIAKLTIPALRRIMEHVSHVHFYDNHKDLQAAYRRAGGTEQVIGFVDPDLAIHLNGGRETQDDTDFSLTEIYAHEFAHLLDTSHGESDNPKWEQAWLGELSGGQLTDRASQDQIEGWAEFGELAILDPNAAKSGFPACYQFWKSKGLAK